MRKYLLIAAMALMLPLVGCSQNAIPASKRIILPDTDLGNFYKVDQGVYRCGQPTARDFVALEKFGIKEVLNLRNFNNDEKEAAGTSLILHRVRTNAGTLTEAQMVEALRIIKNSTGPIVIHCWHGSDRTGGVVALYRMVFQNVPLEEAIDELRNGGYGFHKMYENIIYTLRQIDVEKVRCELGVEIK